MCFIPLGFVFQISIESMWGLLGLLDVNQLLQEAADDSASNSTGTDPSPGSPQIYPTLQQVLSSSDIHHPSAGV